MDFLSMITNPNDNIQTPRSNVSSRTIGGRIDTNASGISTGPPLLSFIPSPESQEGPPNDTRQQSTSDQRGQSSTTTRRRGTRPREEEEGGEGNGSYGGAQKKYGIEFINPQNLERHSPIEEERSKTLKRTTECKATHQIECPICGYDITSITNNTQQIGSSQRRPPKHMLYTPVDHETWKYMYSFILSGLMIRQPVTACQNFATTWNNVILPNLKEEYPEYKQLKQVTSALIYDHYRYFPPTNEVQELFMKLDTEENIRILQDECGIVKRERNGPPGVYYVDKSVSGELKDWINIGRLISKKK